MSISNFFTTTIAVTRMAWSNESSAEISAGSIKAHIQQATPEYAQQIGEGFGKTFLVWCRVDADVETGDTFTISSGSYAGTYSVKNIQVNDTGFNRHLEITAIKDGE